MNFRDLSRNCMAREQGALRGPRGRRGRRDPQAIATQALKLIEVEYEVLPYVIDVDEAMADDAPVLHEDLFTANVEPKPTKPSNIAKRVEFAQGRQAEGLHGGRHRIEGR